jgi:ABC-type glycerol-3-phosphate transport system permease component
MKKRRMGWGTVGLASAVIVITGIVLFPIIQMLLTSFKPQEEIYQLSFLPNRWTLKNYKVMWFEYELSTQFKNSVFITLFATFGTVVISIFAGYSLGRFNYYGRKSLSVMILSTQMFPPILYAVPLYLMLRDLRLLNTFPGVIIAYHSFTLPFCIWMMRNYFRVIPTDLEDAALIDGCNRLGALFRIILPLAKPGIGTTVVFAFLMAWREFMMALQLLRDPIKWTMPVGLMGMFGRWGVSWGPLMAGSIATSLPIIIIFVALQKYFVEGMTKGSVK